MMDVSLFLPCEVPTPAFEFSSTWNLLGPFTVGTREAVWGADPLEHYGGFRSLEYDPSDTFRSSLAVNGTIAWSNITANTTDPDHSHAGVDLALDFPGIEWETMRNIYGWAAYQWQAWVRGEIVVQSDKNEVLNLFTPQILEFWIDGVHYFGGDFYSYESAPVTLRLAAGRHRIDVRLVRDVRSIGGVEEPTMEISLELRKSLGSLQPVLDPQTGVLISDILHTANGDQLASPWASTVLRNDGEADIHVTAVNATHNACVAELHSPEPIRIVPGQSRPVAFKINCVRFDWRIRLDILYYQDDESPQKTLTIVADPTRRELSEPHKVTFMHPGGMVSYTMLRPPSRRAVDAAGQNATLPVMLVLHGAGVEAESDGMRLALEPLPDLPAWALFPTGSTPWSGDDWHIWGSADVGAALASIHDWIRQNEWTGPGADLDQRFVVGHSNGGQGAWYMLTHQPDKVIAAAPLSGYSSVQNYVPYTFWQPADPGRTAVVQAGLSSYRHELLLANTKGIPVFQQHGGADDNVPVYHSRLLSQLIQEAGSTSEYYEPAGEPHFWDGAYTTDPLATFYQQQLALYNASESKTGFFLDDFSLVVANPVDMGSKRGLQVTQLKTPGQIGRIDVGFNPHTSSCTLSTRNILSFNLPTYFAECTFINIDHQTITLPHLATAHKTWPLKSTNQTWHLPSSLSSIPPLLSRMGRQLGPLDSILHTHGPFQITQPSRSPSTNHIALQISRNLHQYFSADTIFSPTYASALAATGNIITIAQGNTLPLSSHNPFPITPSKDNLTIRLPSPSPPLEIPIPSNSGLSAIYLRPLPLGRLELVVWGSDAESLAVAARLVPLIPGSGQPDFVVAEGKEMMRKGLEGVRAMGWMDVEWEVSGNSFLG